MDSGAGPYGTFSALGRGLWPDVLWLHNLHGYYIQVEMLFDWINGILKCR